MSISGGKLDGTLARMDYGRALKGALLMESKPQSWVPYAQPLLDAVALFDELKIGYALVGGVAAMYYGRARFTEDVDFVAVAGHMDVLAANPAVMERHHFDPMCVHKLYHQSGVEIDLWKDEHADGIVGRAGHVELAGRSVCVADPHDLIAMKLRCGRLKDDYDISEILRGSKVDVVRLEGMVTAQEFEKFKAIQARL